MAHRAIYLQHPGIDAIVFAHPVNATAFSVTNSNLIREPSPKAMSFFGMSDAFLTAFNIRTMAR
ncbi:class II aldolase/adducin family protein [Bremerella sp.]|uniref:class II aldolase/adducin family protein n=1 Tax=Bremerella sp. TaxID=2795602 RepID=UPI00391DEB74